MTFSSITFLLYFLPALLLIYYIVPRKAKNTVLFIASLAFYTVGGVKCMLLLLLSTAFNFTSGIAIDKLRHKKAAIIFNAAANIAILIFHRCPGIIAPLGIAFYTLRAMSYTIDVYRRTTATQYNFINFGLYMSFFALIPAGPVVRYNDMARQLNSRRSTGTRFLDGMAIFCAGLCKKAVIADSLYPLWSTISGYDFTGISAAHAWLGIITFILWAYLALSGYMDMAIGLGKMFGFEIRANIYTLYVFITGFVLLMLSNMSDTLHYISAMFSSYGGFGEQDFLYNLTSYAGTIILAMLVASGIPKRIADKLIRHEIIRYIFAIAGFILAVAYI